eukprot:3581600-Pyramimonas_sp.AAC.1
MSRMSKSSRRCSANLPLLVRKASARAFGLLPSVSATFLGVAREERAVETCYSFVVPGLGGVHGGLDVAVVFFCHGTS